MKFKRHKRIIEIINEFDIETQDELIEKLKESGFDVTQATVSRDIKELKVVKVSTHHNSYKYAVTNQDDSIISSKYRNIVSDTVIKADGANNIIVLKTYSGMANAAAAAIDGMNWSEIIGSVAGDDTIIIVTRTNDAANRLKDIFIDMID